jgi:hypothetical protein
MRSRMLRSLSRHRGDWVLAGGVLAFVGAVPLTFLALPADALKVQAALVLVVVFALVVWGSMLGGWRERVLRAPRSVALSLGLYIGAMALGTGVALLRGNDLVKIAGQAVSMGLLPLGALAGLLLAGERALPAFAASVVVADTLFCVGRFAYAAVRTLTLPGVSTAGTLAELHVGATTLLSMVLALGLAAACRGWRRVAAVAVVGLMVVSAVAGTARSMTLSMPIGAAVFAVVGFGPRFWLRRRVLIGAAIVAGVCVLTGGAVTVWWLARRPNLIETPRPAATDASGAAAPVSGGAVAGVEASVEVKRGGYRVRMAASRPSAGVARLGINAVLPAGWEVPIDAVEALVEPGHPVVLEGFADVTWPAVRLHITAVGCELATQAPRSLTVERLGPPAIASLCKLGRNLLSRPPDPGAAGASEVPGQDSSLAFRARESIALVRGFAAASWPARLFGHGLGATFAFDTMGYNGRGHVVQYHNPNYIHNYYLFLLYKLGVVGGASVLLALGLFVGLPVRRAFHHQAGSPSRYLLAAAAGCWISFLAWSFVAPEILDFRMAPLWGLLLAATTATARAPARLPPDSAAVFDSPADLNHK